MLDCDSPFWKFSLAVYAAPGVAAECLALQSELNVDINSLLFCAWLGAAKTILLGDKNLAAIDARVCHWQETVVQPLRALRQKLKSMPEMAQDAVKDLRKDIAGIELKAEQIEQALLFEAADDIAVGAAKASRDNAVRGNVMAVMRRAKLAAPVDASIMPPAALLIAAALAFRGEIP
jgi:uncharacterized protein (TIGR02444 family)